MYYWLGAVLLAASIVCVAYVETFIELVGVWEVDPTYSHGYLVPFISLFIGYWAWTREDLRIPSEVSKREILVGCAIIVVGMLVHWFAMFVGNLLFDVVSLILVLRGLLLIAGGQALRDGLSFALIFLVFMAPLPVGWYQPLAIGMQQFVSVVSAVTLDTLGIPCYREGYFVHLPGYTMEVGEACSGLRQLIAIMALAAAVGFFSGRSLAYRWTLFLLSLPIAVFANCVRVIGSGLILKFFGRKWAEGVYHTLEGLIIVGLAAVVLMVVAWLLAKVMPASKSNETDSDSPSSLAAEG